MAKQVKTYSNFSGGIADYTRENRIPDSFAFARSIDYRTDPTNLTLLPKTIKESGSIVTDLPKWATTYTPDEITYIYGDTGNIYQRNSNHSYSFLRTVANSHGNGMDYFQEDDYLYYTSDKLVGRYGPLSSSSPTFVDDYFGSQGGVPLNTASIDFEASSSQYASCADSSSLSITGDLTLECQIKPESLPSAGNSMTLISKWDESGALRSYKFGINAVSGYFGDGSDGSLTISSDTTDSPIDSACTGTSGSYSLSATNAGFLPGQIILIHQSQLTGAGTYQRNTISSYTAGTITLVEPLNATYTSGAQVLVMKQYTDVTVDSTKTWTAKAWTGSVGGILAFICNGTVTVNGTISANGRGFRGGNAGNNGDNGGYSGEGSGQASTLQAADPTGNGGGSNRVSSAGGGYANTTQSNENGTPVNVFGTSVGTTDLSTMFFGGGGGGGQSGGSANGNGANGGGIIFISCTTLTNAGAIQSNGSNAASVSSANRAGSGGAGGAVNIKAQIATLGSGLITASSGAAGTGGTASNNTAGSVGRIALAYYTSYTGTTSPTANVTQDDSLVTNLTYQLRLSVSSTGLNEDILVRPVSIVTDTWQQVAVSWDASASTAEFFLNAVSIGTDTGTLTSIHDNASTFQVVMNKNGAGSATNFYDGLMDEVRVWSVLKTASDLQSWINMQTTVNLAGLNAYYKFNGDANDTTANANNLTTSGSPVYVSDVPFPSPTTRQDIDQSDPSASGQTYTTPTAISESAANRLTFTPEKDPQKSIAFNIADKGTGNWTVIIHDSQNNLIASKTVANTSLSTGFYEFVFDATWRPLLNTPYHAHVISTVADGTVVTSITTDLESAAFYTYYQFLVTDTQWHPVSKMLQQLVIGNERYVATYEATLYDPMRLTLPAGWVVRCFAYWNEYLAIGAFQGDNVYEVDAGRIYFWDGVADTYNFFIDVPEGAVNAMLGTKGHLYFVAGYQGDLLDYTGGSGATKVKRLPNVTGDTYVDVFPGAMTMWQALLRFGVAGDSDSSVVQKAAYSYGSVNIRYPDSLSCDFPISTGSFTGTNLKIGMLKVVNRQLLIGWQDGTAYGVDYVDLANDPYSTGYIDFIIDDDNVIWKEKEAIQLSGMFTPLESGQSVNIGYKINSNDFVMRGAESTEGVQSVQLQVAGGRYYELQCRLMLNTSTTSPTILGVGVEKDDLRAERRVGGTNG